MSSKLAVWLAVMAWPAASVAQSITFAENGSSATSTTFKGDRCGNTITMRWTYNGTTAMSTNAMDLWATAGTCGNGPDAGDPSLSAAVPYADWYGRRTGTFDVKLSELPIFSSADGGVSCGQTGVKVPAYICAGIGYVVGVTPQAVKGSYAITYDTQPPAVPSSVSCSAEDSALRCSYTVDSDTKKVIATVRSADGADVGSGEGTPSSSGTGSVRIKGLANGESYTVGVRAYDAAGNESAETLSAAVTPIPTAGFFGLLRDAGSTEEGTVGCSMAGTNAGHGSGGEQGLMVFLLPFATLALVRILARRGGR